MIILTQLYGATMYCICYMLDSISRVISTITITCIIIPCTYIVLSIYQFILDVIYLLVNCIQMIVINLFGDDSIPSDYTENILNAIEDQKDNITNYNLSKFSKFPTMLVCDYFMTLYVRHVLLKNDILSNSTIVKLYSSSLTNTVVHIIINDTSYYFYTLDEFLLEDADLDEYTDAEIDEHYIEMNSCLDMVRDNMYNFIGKEYITISDMDVMSIDECSEYNIYTLPELMATLSIKFGIAETDDDVE